MDLNLVLILICIGLCGVMSSDNMHDQLETEWQNFKARFERRYANQSEESVRRAIFVHTLKSVARHNADPGRSYSQGINHLADWTPSELALLTSLPSEDKLSRVLGEDTALKVEFVDMLIRGGDPPASVDWRDSFRVTGVSDQGLCGSCWAFAITGLLEGQQHRSVEFSQPAVPLSAQQLVDCSREAQACSGGASMDEVLREMKAWPGLKSRAHYPYTGKAQSCKMANSENVVKLRGSLKLPRRTTEKDLEKIVANYGPVAVAVHANEDWYNYQLDIFDGATNCEEPANHAVLIVGYGRDKEKGKYWILKNSWSSGWGRGGYMYFRRGVGLCQIGKHTTVAFI